MSDPDEAIRSDQDQRDAIDEMNSEVPEPAQEAAEPAVADETPDVPSDTEKTPEEAQKESEASSPEPKPTASPWKEPQRVRVLMINPIEFMVMFTKGLEFKKHTKILAGVPEDAQLVGVAYDMRREAIMMVVRSSEYELIPPTEIPPAQLVSIKIGSNGTTKKQNVPKRKKK